MVHGDLVVGDLRHLGAVDAEADPRPLGLEPGHGLQRLAPGVGPHERGGVGRDRAGRPVERDLPPAHHRAAVALGQLHRPRRVVADAVAEADARPGQAQIPGVVIGGVELLDLERLDAQVGHQVVEPRQDEAAPGGQLDLPLDLHQREASSPDAGRSRRSGQLAEGVLGAGARAGARPRRRPFPRPGAAGGCRASPPAGPGGRRRRRARRRRPAGRGWPGPGRRTTGTTELASPDPKANNREVSKWRPTGATTRIPSDRPGTPGRSAQAPETTRSIRTPRCDAR